MEIQREPERVRKIARNGEECARLAQEARVLAEAAHPGVVRILETRGGDPPSELVLAEVPGHPLSEFSGRLDWSEVAGLGAALATTLADLHDIGVVHRAVADHHVIIDDAGRPVLCGFGTAVAHRDLAEARRQSAEDVEALALVLIKLGAGAPPRAVERLLKSCSKKRLGSTPVNARRLARALVNQLPDARLPGLPAISAPVTARLGPRNYPTVRRFDRRKIRALGVLMIGLATACLAVTHNRHDSAMPTIACPLVDNGCSPNAVRSGSVISGPSGKFMLLGIAGTELVGRWHCTAPLPVVLDISRGNLWAFREWPGAGGDSAQLAKTVPHATGMHLLPGSGRKSACDSLLVERRHLSPVLVAFPRAG